MRWPLQLLQPLQKTQLQPSFGPSVYLLYHPCITTTHLSYSVLSLKLPPPPCAVLLVIVYHKIPITSFHNWEYEGLCALDMHMTHHKITNRSEKTSPWNHRNIAIKSPNMTFKLSTKPKWRPDKVFISRQGFSGSLHEFSVPPFKQILLNVGWEWANPLCKFSSLSSHSHSHSHPSPIPHKSERKAKKNKPAFFKAIWGFKPTGLENIQTVEELLKVGIGTPATCNFSHLVDSDQSPRIVGRLVHPAIFFRMSRVHPLKELG